jgi:hypothetical protein
MNSEHDQNLEARIGRVLKELPELSAPSTLMPRVLGIIARQRALPWYRQPWPVWPIALRVATMIFLLASFGGLCLASFELTRAAGFTNAMQEIGHTFSGLSSVWNVLTVLASAVVLVLKHLGTGFMIGCCLAAALGYAVCVGLGTACVRLAYARK